MLKMQPRLSIEISCEDKLAFWHAISSTLQESADLPLVCPTYDREAACSIVRGQPWQQQQLAPPGLQQRFHRVQMPIMRTDVEAAGSMSAVSITSSRPPASSCAFTTSTCPSRALM